MLYVKYDLNYLNLNIMRGIDIKVSNIIIHIIDANTILYI